MLDLKTISSLREVEKKSGVQLLPLLSSVPFGNVFTAFSNIPVTDIVDMVVGVSPSKLVHGLSIITPNQIEEVPVENLKAVLFHGNMGTVGKLQERIKEGYIIHALREMSSEEICELLVRDDYEEISRRIYDLNGVIN